MTPEERAKEYASKAIESIVKELEETTGNKYEPTDRAISEIEQHYLAGYNQEIKDIETSVIKKEKIIKVIDMSHFCVLVIGENPEDQLAKYDENLDVPMHLVFTKEQIIKKERDRIEKYKKGLYAEYLADPEKYKENCHNEAHLKYISEEFPKKLEWTDKQCYEAAIKDYRDYIEEGEKWCEVHEDGSLWRTTNDNAKWDWYQKGGRFRGLLKLKKPNKKAPLYNGWEWNDVSPYEYEQLKNEGFCDQAYVKDVANLNEIVTFAIIKDGEWHERGEMGWWCSVSNEKNQDTWEAEVRSLLADLPGDTLLTVVDCHI